MVSSKNDLPGRYEEERLRTQEQSQLLYLQNQIDDLRRQVKDTNNKYGWAMEQIRKSEAVITQLQSMLERQAQEQVQTLEGYRREITTMRKEIANSTIKIDDTTKPIRDIQVSLGNLAEQRKQDSQTAQSWFARVELTEQRFGDLDTRLRDHVDQQRMYTAQLDGLREADAQINQDVRRLSEEVQIEKQNIRRQTVESQQMIVDSHASVTEVISRTERLDQMIKSVEAQVEAIPEQIEFIQVQLPDMIAELKRIERVSTERFLMNQERLEELRSQQNQQLDEQRLVEEQHIRQVTSWIDRIDAWCLEYEGKLARTQSRLEDVQISHLDRIQEQERRELQTLSNLIESLQQRLSVAQSEVVAQNTNPHP